MTDSLLSRTLEHYGADLHRVRESGWCPIKCPFHDDRQASASVNLTLGGFKCHGCDVSGDALKLIADREGIDREDAKRFAQETIGAECGDIPRAASRRAPKRHPSKWRKQLSL
jgi:DNA primase